MFVLMQYKTVAALTNVRADSVDALVLAAAVVLAALILVCERHTCNTSLVWKQGGGAEGTGSARKQHRQKCTRKYVATVQTRLLAGLQDIRS